MSELIRNLEKSIAFLRQRYAADLPLLVSLEEKLERLKARKGISSSEEVPTERERME